MADVPVLTDDRRLSLAYSRGETQATRQLGYVQSPTSGKAKKVRDKKLEIYDAYYDSRQYDSLTPWESALKAKVFVPVRDRKPRIIYNFGKMLCSRVAAKLVGQNVFPSFKVEDDPDTTDFIRAIVQISNISNRIVEPVRRMLNSGSSLIRYYLEEGAVKTEHFAGNVCYPEFLPNGELAFVMIRYTYIDKADTDPSGRPKEKWYRMDLGPITETLYDNPVYQANAEPEFKVVQQVAHNLGFVQAEWFRTCIRKESPDGESLVSEILDFIDEFNYNLSQSSTAIAYNQDPQAIINGLDADEIDQLIKSSTKAWNLGKEGKAEFLESSLTGVTTAEEFRDHVRQNIQDVVRVVMLNPDKIVGNAQSAKAMEVLHGPLLELINELRPIVEESLERIIVKMAVTMLMLNAQGLQVPLSIPPNYKPLSFNLITTWPPVFPLTVLDLKDRVAWISAATAGNLLSRESGTRILAKDFGIEDVEEEIAKIAAQPVLNPFGGGF